MSRPAADARSYMEKACPQLADRFARLVERVGAPPDWARITRPLEVNGVPIHSPREDMPTERNSTWVMGHDIGRGADGTIVWVTWTVEDRRVQKNSLAVLGAGATTVLRLAINYFAFGWTLDGEPEYLVKMLDEMLAAPYQQGGWAVV